MERDDEVLFFISGTNLCKYHGRVIFKAESDEFGKFLWPYDSLNWKLIYFVDDLSSVAIDKWALMSAFGYDNEKDVLAGIRRVPEDSVREIFAKYGTIGQFLNAVGTAPPFSPLRLQCADLRASSRSTGKSKKSRPIMPTDAREALRKVIAENHWPMPPAKDVPKLMENVSTRASDTEISMTECAAWVLEEYSAIPKR
jgi:hypothetical protein